MKAAVTALLVLLALPVPASAQPGDETRSHTGSAEPVFSADTWYLPDDPLLGFSLIPAGSFLMGSDPAIDRMAFENERWSSDRRQGRVELPAYYLGRYEVTVAQYRAFVEATGRRADPLALAGADNHPVSHVSWIDALAYTRWLEEQLKDSPETPDALKQKLQQGWRLTLPSEAEWEMAARGVSNRIFPWGNQPRPDRGNYVTDAAPPGPAPVGSFDCPECAYGLADMSGNVWELTRSPLQPYPYSDADDREAASADALWVMRGGSFSDGINLVRAAVRGAVDPSARANNIGFRLALTPAL